MQGDTRDFDRTIFLNSLDIEVLRFENKEIWKNIELINYNKLSPPPLAVPILLAKRRNLKTRKNCPSYKEGRATLLRREIKQ